MTITMKALSPATRDDFLDFFDNRAFTDNPDWAGCYCMYFYNTGTETEFLQRPAEQKRREALELIQNGTMQGFLAFSENAPVGWCNVNAKSAYPFLLADPRLRSPEDPGVRSLVCMTVDPSYRRRGVARHILEHVLEDHRLHHGGILEAYPRNNPSSDAENYHGPMGLYLSAGFTAVKTLEEYTILRYISR